MTRIHTILFFALLATAACGGKKEDKAAEPTAGSATDTGSGSAAAMGSATVTPDAAVAEPEPVEVPTAMDFEEDAEARITEKNLATEVQEFEKEIAQ
jgi:hypothetical protein